MASNLPGGTAIHHGAFSNAFSSGSTWMPCSFAYAKRKRPRCGVTRFRLSDSGLVLDYWKAEVPDIYALSDGP